MKKALIFIPLFISSLSIGILPLSYAEKAEDNADESQQELFKKIEELTGAKGNFDKKEKGLAGFSDSRNIDWLRNN